MKSPLPYTAVVRGFTLLQMQDAPNHYSMIATPDTEYWRRIRKTINEAFSPAAMRKVGGCGQ